jgi:hypothetical protein
MNVSAILFDPQQGHARISALFRDLKGELLQGRRHIITIKPETRSAAQNSRLWVLLNALSKQVEWHGQRLTPEEWKDACTAAIKRQKVIPGLDGGFVVLGSSTSAMTRAEHAELQDFIEAFGAQQGVDFGELLAAEPA